MVDKICPHCHKTLPRTLEFFYVDKSHKDGFSSWCGKCNNQRRHDYLKTPKGKLSSKASRLKCAYNLTLEQRKNMYVQQNGCCAICGKPVPYDEIDTDHNHKTNKVRELLCRECNLFSGRVENNLELVYKIMDYLKKHGNTSIKTI